MNNGKSLALFLIGLSFYGIAEFSTLMRGSIVWLVLHPANVPLGEMLLVIDFYHPLFMMTIIPALFLLTLSIQYLRLPPFRSSLMCTWVALACLFAIPDLMWPIGDVYYETLKFYFGLSSEILAFILVLAYLGERRKP